MAFYDIEPFSSHPVENPDKISAHFMRKVIHDMTLVIDERTYIEEYTLY